MRRIEAFCWMLRIPWTPRFLDEAVLERIGREHELSTIVKRKKTAYFGHVIIKGKIEGSRGPGTRQLSWMTSRARQE